MATLRHCAELLLLTSSGVGWLKRKTKLKVNLNQKIWFKSNKSDFFFFEKIKKSPTLLYGWPLTIHNLLFFFFLKKCTICSDDRNLHTFQSEVKFGNKFKYTCACIPTFLHALLKFFMHQMTYQIFCEELVNCQLKTLLFDFKWTGLPMSKHH